MSKFIKKTKYSKNIERFQNIKLEIENWNEDLQIFVDRYENSLADPNENMTFKPISFLEIKLISYQK